MLNLENESGAIKSVKSKPPLFGILVTIMALPLPALAQTVDNTVNITLPAAVSDPDPANNTATDSDTLTTSSGSTPPTSNCLMNPPNFSDFGFTAITNDTGSGTGRSWTYPDAIDYLGESVDIEVTVLSLVGTTDFDSVTIGSTSASTVMQSISSGFTEAEIRWDFVRASDGSPIAISTEVEFGDLDLRSGRLEYIEINRVDYDGYELVSGSLVDVSSDSIVDRFDGTVDASSQPTQAVKFTMQNRTSFTWTQGMEHLGTGSSGRAGFTANGPPFAVTGCDRYDFSDAQGYSTAQHNAFDTLTLGTTISAETAALTTANADGDVDDGVMLPTFNLGGTSVIDVAVTEENPGDAYLQGWIDFNGDGGFGGSEQIASDLQDDGTGDDLVAGDGIINVSVSTPTGATTGQTVARFRWSTVQGLSATADAPSGEVEDYILTPVAIVADLSITKTNTPGVNGEVDQAADTLVFGTTTTYTLVVTNNGPDAVTGAVVTDTPGAGISCAATNPVTLSGDGIPSGSFTVADLTGGGIALDTLADGEATTLTFDCTVQ